MLDRAGNALAVLGLLVFASGFVTVSGAASEQGSSASLEHTQGLAARPAWLPGETWQLQVTDSYSLQPYEVQVTAGGLNASVLGLRPDDYQTPILVDRIVPLGSITDPGNRTSLSYEVDDAPFTMLDFPLTQRKHWITHLGTDEILAHVTDVTDGLATVVLQSQNSLVPTMTVVYDSVLGFPSSVEMHGFARFVVVGHGFASTCDSAKPSKLDVAFNEGQARTGLLPKAQAPPLEVNVADGYDGIAIALFASSASGFQRAIVNAPDGAQYASDPVAAAQGSFHAHFDNQRPAGQWSIERESIGPGFAQASGLAYALEPLEESCQAVPAIAATSAIGVSPVPSSPFGQLMRWAAAAVIELAAVLVRFRRTIGTGLQYLLIVPLFARLTRKGVLQHATRQKILDVVKATPGLSTQDIRQRCDLAWAEARYHLELLLSHGVLDAVRWGRNRNWFLADAAGLEAQRKAAALNRPGARSLFEAIQASPGASPAELARNLNVHHSTIAYHISWLERADLVRRERVGREARCYPA